MDDSRKSKAQLIAELQALRKQVASSSGKAAANQIPVSRQQSKDRYRIVSELTSDYAFAYRVEPGGEMVREWVTGALLKISGFTAEDLETRGGWPSMIHPDDLMIPLGQFKTIMQGQPDTVEYRIITKSGAVRWTRDYARPEWDEQQQRVTHIYGAIQDITERKLAEQALENKNHQLELLLQIAQRLTASLDSQEVLTRVGVDAKQVLTSHGCSIYLLEPGGQTLLPVVALDPLYGEELLHTPLTVEGSFTGQAVQSRQSLIFNDAETYDIGQQIPGTPNEHEHIINAPFIAGEKC